MEPLATYQTNGFEGKRSYQLGLEEVRVTGNTGEMSFEATFPLAKLMPHFQRVKRHTRLFYWGAYLAVTGGTGVSLLGYTLDLHQGSLGHLTYVAFTAMMVGVVWALIFSRQVSHFVFLWDSGTVAFEIVKSGKQGNDCSSFVEAIVEGIKREKKSQQEKTKG